MKVFCTGNISRKTVAYALTDLLLDTTSASLSTGWDFTNFNTLKNLRQTILNYNVFVNSAYIDAGVQLNLMNTVYKEWMKENIRGHIINIGTTLEYSKEHHNDSYVTSKLQLKQQSLQLSEQTGITGVKTTYIVLVGIANGEICNADYVKPKDIALTIKWVLDQRFRIPLIQLED